MNTGLMCGVFVRTRTFPSGDVGSAGGELELDDVGDAQFLQKLCALCLEDSNAKLRGVRWDRRVRRGDTRQYAHAWKSISEQPSIVAIMVGASWDVGTDAAREWGVVWRSTDETKALLSAD